MTCERCGCQGLTDTDLTDGGDPDLPAVIPPPVGWINAEDSDGYICGACAQPEEIEHHMEAAALIEDTMVLDDP